VSNPSLPAKSLRGSTIRVVPCTVRFTDRQNKEHSVTVKAATLYEAAGKTRRVNLEKMLAYMDRVRKGREDTPHKQRLRWLSDAFIRIKHGEEKADAQVTFVGPDE
jgi:hypothetical protein